MDQIDEESYWTREVYAHFGLAMYGAQCVEQAIFQNFMFFSFFPNAVKTVKSKKDWTEKFEAFEAKELKRTMGALLRQLASHGQSSGELDRLFPEVLKKRNWLAHSYFDGRAIEFTSIDGKHSMISELEDIQQLFRRTEDLLSEVTRPVAEKYGLTEEALADATAEMVARHNQQAEQGGGGQPDTR